MENAGLGVAGMPDPMEEEDDDVPATVMVKQGEGVKQEPGVKQDMTERKPAALKPQTKPSIDLTQTPEKMFAEADKQGREIILVSKHKKAVLEGRWGNADVVVYEDLVADSSEDADTDEDAKPAAKKDKEKDDSGDQDD